MFTNTTKLTFRIIVISLIVFLFASCEKDIVKPEAYSADFTVSSILFSGESFSVEVSNTGSISNLEWVISDGSVYYTDAIQHTFNESGDYTITLNCYSNNNLVSTVTKSVSVLSIGKTFSAEGSLSVTDVSYTNGNIILNMCETLESDNTSEKAYYVYTFDTELTLISKEKSSSAIETYSESDMTCVLDEFEVISFTGGNSASQQMIYKSGVIIASMNENNEVKVSYLNESYEKLWTKEFPRNTFSGAAYLTSLDEKLFFICFNDTMDSIYIEKFSNPSIVYNQKTLSLDDLLSGVELLFSFVNANTQEIQFGVYQKETDRSAVFSMDASFNLNVPLVVEGYFDATIEDVSDKGMVLLRNSNQIYSYTSDWELSASTELDSDSYGICPIGENFSLLYENLSDGTVQLSFLDKHLNQVAF